MAIYVNLYHGKEYRKAAFIDYYHNSEIPLAANLCLYFLFLFSHNCIYNKYFILSKKSFFNTIYINF